MDDGRVTMAELFDALSEVDANELASAGRHYASGLLKVEPSELMTVRLPRVLAALFHDANS
jgi:hypothetical protein